MKLLRLDKIIADNTNLSRKDVQKLAKNNLIMVNGEICNKVTEKFNPEEIDIVIDGEHIVLNYKPSVLIFNKPEGYVCANHDDVNLTVFHLLPDGYNSFHCVGRLDLDTSGLLLLTNDGNFSHRLSSPKHHVAKKYYVTLADPYEDSYLIQMQEGILLRGERDKTKPAILEFTDDPYRVYLTITEGRYHQVKRMFGALGNKVVELQRVAIGNLTLPEDLAEGEYLEVDVAEALALINGSD
ncbi:hypothetical protein CKF54_05235 [Psittacicella hinzii]|uniref:Pseudouridine synthase n=1 Tax=Psittacicella hinzii TaxID=2028575 RepID=A0A3A1Y465_9GAMM|nr:pseudouridine synthase [Psittacicella hinzii]RIY32241.1 hypothetical protein CKF54_05235 [Psittacicella hinzii]